MAALRVDSSMAGAGGGATLAPPWVGGGASRQPLSCSRRASEESAPPSEIVEEPRRPREDLGAERLAQRRRGADHGRAQRLAEQEAIEDRRGERRQLEVADLVVGVAVHEERRRLARGHVASALVG